MPRVAVLAFPGTNCEYESVRACRAAGLDAEIVRWNEPERLSACDAYFLAGGFSFQDRVRAGAIAAKEAVLSEVSRAADAGKPVLGVCNGAQTLLEAGLVPGLAPGHPLEMALDSNAHGYLCRWTYLRVENPAKSLFTALYEEGEVVPVPMAHAEGRYTTADPSVLARIEAGGQVAFRFAGPDGSPADGGYPVNPNGALGDIAGVTNPAGNVLAVMPHPERASWLWQLPRELAGPWGERRRAYDGKTRGLNPLSEAGPGRKLFGSLAAHLKGAV
jgi:phosphoribosylformylglycinamidine synthase I